jgi:hypothetical protein
MIPLRDRTHDEHLAVVSEPGGGAVEKETRP